MTRIASRHSGRRPSPASRRSRLKSDIEMHYCISRFTMQEQILQLSSTIKPGGATSPLPATPSRNRTNAKIKLSAKTTQYRNQISTLLGVSPRKFQTTSNWEGQRPRCPPPPKSSYLKNSTTTSVNFHSSKGPSPEVPRNFHHDLLPASQYGLDHRPKLAPLFRLPRPTRPARSMQGSKPHRVSNLLQRPQLLYRIERTCTPDNFMRDHGPP